MPRSALACHACRKRKVKCDRQFPQCLVCDQTGQTCNYPLRSMKPGPKIGSSQKQRKCRRLKETASSRHASSYSSPPVGPGINPQGSDLDILDNGSEKGEVVPAVPTDPTETSARVETRKGEQQRASHSNTLDLAFILHPSHEATTPGHTFKQSPNSQDHGHVGLCRQACKELHVSQAAMNKIIRVFFDNMVAINIFHEPSFAKKLSKISSLPQLTGLLAAIAAYALRFEALGADDLASNTVQLAAMRHHQPAYFIELAFKYINEALMECEDGTPPLCVIQALIIATHCRLTQGVRGKAWRSLGLCVSLIYETNLHLLDSKKVGKAEDLNRWQEDEEKRRAFWAVWEMDVFASTIRRTPTGIDWNQMEVLLPVDNVHWFSGHPVSSCFMEIEPNQRWRPLQDCGNQSPKAWFLIINSLMKDAQIVCDPQAVSTIYRGYHHPKPNYRTSTSQSAVETRQRLETLANAVRCFSLALPGHLRYREQYLAFRAPVEVRLESERQQHCSIYNIFVMTQLSRLMIYRYDAFRSQNRRSEVEARSCSEGSASRGTFSAFDTENGALVQYYDAADCILGIVNRSCEEHIHHINPFLSSTIWLASAVQLVRKHFVQACSDRNLIKSRFDVLYLTYKRCVQFWDVQTALQRNLEIIEEQLEARHKRPVTRAPSSQEASKPPPEDTRTTHQPLSDREGHGMERSAKKAQTPRQVAQYLPETPGLPPTSSLLIDDGLEMNPQYSAQQRPYAADSVAMLDFMTLPQPTRNQVSEDHMVPTSSDFLDSMYLGDFELDRALYWPTFDFPGGTHDLSAGWITG